MSRIDRSWAEIRHGNDDDHLDHADRLQQSLLGSKIELPPSSTGGAVPPLSAFKFGRTLLSVDDENVAERDSVGEDQNADAVGDGGMFLGDPMMSKEERKEMEVNLRILGIPFGQTKQFWLLTLPLSMLLGFFVGLGTLAFFGLYRFLFFGWLNGLTAGDGFGPRFAPSEVANLEGKDGSSMVVESLGNVGQWGGDWRWLLVTTSGGLLAGLVLLFPNAPNLGESRNMFHDAVDLKGHTKAAPYVILSCFVSLCSGAPIGPEMAVGTLGSALASLIASLCNLGARPEAALVLCGLAGSLGGLFPSPLLGVLIVHELSTVGRPGDTRLDAVGSRRTLNERGDDVLFDERGSKRISEGRDHDFMEQVTLACCAATVAFVTFRGLRPEPTLELVELSQIATFEMWHLAAAVPLGLLCGVFGTLFLILSGLFRTIRSRMSHRLRQRGAPEWFRQLLFPTLAGLLHGVIAVAYPLTIGSGTEIIADLLALGFHDTSAAAIQNGSDVITPRLLLTSAFLKILSSSLCLGLGLVGGQIFPLIFAGLCVGFAVPHYIVFIPASVAVPCCMSAIVGSFVPIPFTLVICIGLAMSMSAEMIGPVLVATIVAFTTNGGLGLVKKMGEKRLGQSQDCRGGASQSLMENGDVDVPDPPSHDVLVRGVRTAIFGG